MKALQVFSTRLRPYLMSMVLLCIFQTSALSQGTSWGYLYVYPSDSTAYPIGTGILTNNATLNDVFSYYQVVKYELSFPGADGESIENAHEIHLDGDVELLKEKLENLGLFSTIELAGYYATLGTQNSSSTITPVNLLPGDCMGCEDPIEVTDPNTSWELEFVGAPCAWTITEGSPDVIVAVIDTEFDETHPDLLGKIVNEVGNDANTPAGCNHGTSVCGVLTSIPVGKPVDQLQPEIPVHIPIIETSGIRENIGGKLL